jgi:adenylate cyclase
MSDVFISYARSTEKQAQAMAEAFRKLGRSVWIDEQLPAHRNYSHVIAEELNRAAAVLVIWSAEAAMSDWVMDEAERAREQHKLVQVRLDKTRLPMPFGRIQCADLSEWTGALDAPGWRTVAASVAELLAASNISSPVDAATIAVAPHRPSICVLPFTNMSGDPEQEYFSDGISEDIITDLSKVSSLSVIARNTAFTFKGKAVDVSVVARRLGVGYVLEGSVRKAGKRVRITAQLIDGAAGDHIWAERYDRKLTDIFALQDEVSEAIVAALRLRLLPEEKRAIERRDTDSVEAFDLYLHARQHAAAGNLGDPQRNETIIRLCQRALTIDPGYARAWSLLAAAEIDLRFTYGRADIDSWASLEKALSIDPELADAHALKGGLLRLEGRLEEAAQALEVALRFDPESPQANNAAAYLAFTRSRFDEAIRHFEKVVELSPTAYEPSGMLITCYAGIGDTDGARRSAQTTLSRAEAALADDKTNGSAMGYLVSALATLGEAAQARDWIRRALLLDPDNQDMRYNLACALVVDLKDYDAALELLGPVLSSLKSASQLSHLRADPDMSAIRADPRFQTMLASAEARLKQADSSGDAPDSE